MELLTVKDLCDLLKLTRTRIYAHVATGRIPAPFHPTPRCPRWRRDVIESWIAEREREAA